MVLTVDRLKDIATLLRRDVLEETTEAGSGHPTTCLSAVEILTVLYFHEMTYDTSNGNNPDNDEFVLSKGHAAPLLYAVLKRAKCIGDDLSTLRKMTSRLEGHPVPPLDGWVKVATGSLGQGLAVGAGMALAAKLKGKKYKTYVLMGDSECAEGSISEAAELASHYKLNNLCAIIDVNRLGQRGETMHGYNTQFYKKKFENLGWATVEVNGHNISQLLEALKKFNKSTKPVMIIAKTVKGKGVSFLENKEGWHGKALSKEELRKALKEIGEEIMPDLAPKIPSSTKIKPADEKKITGTNYGFGSLVATREAYGKALSQQAYANPNVLALDAEVSNSTFANIVKEEAPKQFIECYIAEQTMIGLAAGLAAKGYRVFASTFSAFLTRAHDQLRMAALSKIPFVVCGSHSGTSIGEDGASQMGLDDLAMFRAMPNTNVFAPSDATSTEKIVGLVATLDNISYIRTTRPKLPVIYRNSEEFMPGDFKILKSSLYDSVVLAGHGVAVHELLIAQEILKKEGISAAVIDCFSIKPFKASKFIDFVKEHGSKVIVAEDHYLEGGLGEMLSAVCSQSNIIIKQLGVHGIPHSGTKEEQFERYNLNCDGVVRVTKALLK